MSIVRPAEALVADEEARVAYDTDVLVIGLGPAGMAVSIMASQMGLKVTAIERRALGGECMNVGCIPSKSLLRIAKARHAVTSFPKMALRGTPPPEVGGAFEKVRGYLEYINDAKTVGLFDKVDLHLREGSAEFVDARTVSVGDRRISARRIYIATGTEPAVPPIPGLAGVDVLTNENLFALDRVPESMVVIGGGAIGCEMAQAFARLGCRTSIVHMDAHLIPNGDPEAGALLEGRLREEGIAVFNKRRIERVEKAGDSGGVVVHTDANERIAGARLLLAAGRRIPVEGLRLANAGVEATDRGIIVDKHLRTSARHIYAVGDCNGHHLFSHSAMHQGMLALMNSMLPWPLRRDFREYVVPWTIFTEPQVSQVGLGEHELRARGIRYETIRAEYGDYGAAIAEGVDVGFIKVFASRLGRVYGVVIVGEGSGEMINEWALAIQAGVRLHRILFLQHSFPTMGFLSKRIAEIWMTNRMQASPGLRRVSRWMYRR